MLFSADVESVSLHGAVLRKNNNKKKQENAFNLTVLVKEAKAKDFLPFKGIIIFVVKLLSFYSFHSGLL